MWRTKTKLPGAKAVCSCTRTFPVGSCWTWGCYVAVSLPGTTLRATALPYSPSALLNSPTRSLCLCFNVVSAASAGCPLVKDLLLFHREFHRGQKLVLEHRCPHGAGASLADPGISSAELLGVTRCHESSI